MIVKDKVEAEKQGLNTTTPTEVVKPSLAVIDTTTPNVTNYPISERGKVKSREVIFHDYFIPEFQDMLNVYGKNAAIKVTAEYLSGSFGRFHNYLQECAK